MSQDCGNGRASADCCFAEVSCSMFVSRVILAFIFFRDNVHSWIIKFTFTKFICTGYCNLFNLFLHLDAGPQPRPSNSYFCVCMVDGGIRGGGKEKSTTVFGFLKNRLECLQTTKLETKCPLSFPSFATPAPLLEPLCLATVLVFWVLFSFQWLLFCVHTCAPSFRVFYSLTNV